MNEINAHGIGSFEAVLKTSAYRSRTVRPGITELIVQREAKKFKAVYEAADEGKSRVKSLIVSQKEKAQQRRTSIIVTKLVESCKQIEEQTATENLKTQRRLLK